MTTLLREAAELVLDLLDKKNGWLTNKDYANARLVLMAALLREQPSCVCGEPTALGIVHRVEGRCFLYQE